MGVAREARNEVHVLGHELKAEAWLRIRKGTERLSRLEQELQEFLCRMDRLAASAMALGQKLSWREKQQQEEEEAKRFAAEEARRLDVKEAKCLAPEEANVWLPQRKQSVSPRWRLGESLKCGCQGRVSMGS